MAYAFNDDRSKVAVSPKAETDAAMLQEADTRASEDALTRTMVNNIIANPLTEEATIQEVVGIRTGYDSTVYGSAGDAVRGQVSTFKNLGFPLKNYLFDYQYDNFYLPVDMSEDTRGRICSATMVHLNAGDTIVSNDPNIKISAKFYKIEDDSIDATSTWENRIIAEYEAMALINVKKSDDSKFTAAEAEAAAMKIFIFSSDYDQPWFSGIDIPTCDVKPFLTHHAAPIVGSNISYSWRAHLCAFSEFMVDDPVLVKFKTDRVAAKLEVFYYDDDLDVYAYENDYAADSTNSSRIVIPPNTKCMIVVYLDPADPNVAYFKDIRNVYKYLSFERLDSKKTDSLKDLGVKYTTRLLPADATEHPYWMNVSMLHLHKGDILYCADLNIYSFSVVDIQEVGSIFNKDDSSYYERGIAVEVEKDGFYDIRINPVDIGFSTFYDSTNAEKVLEKIFVHTNSSPVMINTFPYAVDVVDDITFLEGSYNADGVGVATSGTMMSTRDILRNIDFIDSNKFALLFLMYKGDEYLGKVKASNHELDKVAGDWWGSRYYTNVAKLMENFDADGVKVIINLEQYNFNYYSTQDKIDFLNNTVSFYKRAGSPYLKGNSEITNNYSIGPDFVRRSIRSIKKLGNLTYLQAFCIYDGKYYSTNGTNISIQNSSFTEVANHTLSVGHGNSFQLGNNDTAYVSGWDDNKVYIVNMANMTLGTPISLPTTGYTTAAIDDLNGIAYIFQRDSYPDYEDNYNFIVYDYINQQILSSKVIRAYAAMQSVDFYNGRIAVLYGLGSSTCPSGLFVCNTNGDTICDIYLDVVINTEPEGIFFDRANGKLYISDVGTNLYEIANLD